MMGIAYTEISTPTRPPFSDPIETPVPSTTTPQEQITHTPTPTEAEPVESPTPSPTMAEETPTGTVQPSPTATEEDSVEVGTIGGTPTPGGSPTQTEAPTATQTATETVELPTATPTQTATSTPTETEEPTSTPAETEEPSPTVTETVTLTPTLQATETLEELPRLDSVESVDFTGATYTYDGDGESILRIACGEFSQSENSRLNCVSSSYVNGLTTFYVGGYYEYVEVEDGDDTITTETKYYTGATGRFAMRVDTETTNGMISTTTNELYWIFSDHLQSSSVILDEDGDVYSRTTYTAFGEVRNTVGSSPTDYTYTGQRSYTDDFGLMYYVARWFDPVTAHFASADTIIPQPGNAGDWNRYAYVLYNPANFNDPSGHFTDDETELQKWFGENWKDLFSQEWQRILISAKFGDAIAYMWNGNMPNFAVFVNNGGMLALWLISDKGGSLTSVEYISNISDNDDLALYRPYNVPIDGGASSPDGLAACMWMGEFTSPSEHHYLFGINTYVYIMGKLLGEESYEFPSTWNQGYSGGGVEVDDHWAGWNVPWSEVVEDSAQLAVDLIAYLGSISLKEISGRALLQGVGRVISKAAGPVGVYFTVNSVCKATSWDSSYTVVNYYVGPMVPVPSPGD